MLKGVLKIEKGIVLSIIFLASMCLFKRISFAADPSLENPTLGMLSSIFGRLFNTALVVSGVIMVAVVAYGVWKSSLALGDPRGLEGAKQTWTYAVYGFLVIVLFFVIFLIITNIFGIESTKNPGVVLDELFDAIVNDLLDIPNSSSRNGKPAIP